MSLKSKLNIVIFGLISLYCGIAPARCIESDIQSPTFCGTVSKSDGKVEVAADGACYLNLVVKEVTEATPKFATFPRTMKRLKSQKSILANADVVSCQKLEKGETVRGVLLKICNDNKTKWLPGKKYPDYSFSQSAELNLGPNKGTKVKCPELK